MSIITTLVWTLILAGCSGGGACDTTSSCLVIPEGWNGPALVQEGLRGEPNPACDTVYSQPAVSAYDGLVADDAVCDCECGPTRAVGTCPETADLMVFENQRLDCDQRDPMSTRSISEGCTATAVLNDVAVLVSVPPVAVPGASCEAIGGVDRPPAAWEQQLSVCELPERRSCGRDSACTPEPEGAGEVCIWSDGDVACPGGAFPQRRVAYRSVDDARGCTECTCGDAMSHCSAELEFHGPPSCDGANWRDASTDECLTLVGFMSGVELTYGEPEVACEPALAEPIGDAAGDDPITICCQPA